MRHLLNVFVAATFCIVLLQSCGSKESEKDLLSKAETFEQENKYEEALHALEKLVRDYPTSENAPEALHRAAFLYYNNINDFNKSIEYHRKLIEVYPKSKYVPQSRFMIGFIYANDLRDYASAKTAYDEFLKYHPDHELLESVKWELQHLGEDVNEQLEDLFGEHGAKGKAMAQ